NPAIRSECQGRLLRRAWADVLLQVPLRSIPDVEIPIGSPAGEQPAVRRPGEEFGRAWLFGARRAVLTRCDVPQIQFTARCRDGQRVAIGRPGDGGRRFRLPREEASWPAGGGVPDGQVAGATDGGNRGAVRRRAHADDGARRYVGGKD